MTDSLQDAVNVTNLQGVCLVYCYPATARSHMEGGNVPYLLR